MDKFTDDEVADVKKFLTKLRPTMKGFIVVVDSEETANTITSCGLTTVLHAIRTLKKIAVRETDVFTELEEEIEVKEAYGLTPWLGIGIVALLAFILIRIF